MTNIHFIWKKDLLIFKSNHNSIIEKICDNCLWGEEKRTKLKALVMQPDGYFFVSMFWFFFFFPFFFHLVSSLHSISIGLQTFNLYKCRHGTAQHSVAQHNILVNCEQIKPIFVFHYKLKRKLIENFTSLLNKQRHSLCQVHVFFVLSFRLIFFINGALHATVLLYFSIVSTFLASIAKNSIQMLISIDTICFLCLVILPFGH